jgi:hypothetical protein
LEEKGFISKAEKGIIKDLIISGDAMLQNALDKFEQGDKNELNDLCRSLLARRGSIDLLENMDLDFAVLGGNEKDADGNISISFKDELFGMVNDFAEDDEGSGITTEMANRLRRASIDSNLGMPGLIFKGFEELTESVLGNDGIAFAGNTSSTASTSTFNVNDNASSSNDTQTHSRPSHRSSSITSALMSIGGDETLLTGFNADMFDDHQQQVELSAYEAMAKSLSATKSKGKNDKGKSAEKGEKGRRNYHTSSYRTPSSSNKLSSQTSHGSTASNASGINAGSTGMNGGSRRNGQYANMSAAIAAEVSQQMNSFDPEDTDAISMTIAGGPLWAKNAEGGENNGYIGAYSPEQRRRRIERFIEKRSRRVWTKKVKYDVRKNFADSRLRVKGRFVKKEDEEIMRELMTI